MTTLTDDVIHIYFSMLPINQNNRLKNDQLNSNKKVQTNDISHGEYIL